MTYRLRHNTNIGAALAMIADRCVRAPVQKGQKYGLTLSHGPYFFVEDMPVDEVITGGKDGNANLYFDCDLPSKNVLSTTLATALRPGDDGKAKKDRALYEGKLLLCYRWQESNGDYRQFREAVILPFEGEKELLPDCLRLTKYEPEALFRSAPLLKRKKLKEEADRIIAAREPFSVGIRHT